MVSVLYNKQKINDFKTYVFHLSFFIILLHIINVADEPVDLNKFMIEKRN